MKKAKRIISALGTPLFAWLALTNTQALASISCNTVPGVRAGMSCTNGGENGTTLTVRHVPAWGPNAGYVLVDMCPGETTPTGIDHPSQKTVIGQDEVVITTQLPPKTPISQEPPQECLRRYCTDDVSEFAVRVAATPIPIGFDFFLGIAIAFRHSKFEITCETVRQPGGISP